MSDLSKIIVSTITNNYCEVKIEQYVNNVDSALNISLKEDEQVRNATLFAYLLDLANYHNTFKGKEILNGRKENAFYDLESAKEIIARSEIIEWNVSPAEMNFVTRIYFTEANWLNGFEVGMNNSTTLDTWICDWL